MQLLAEEPLATTLVPKVVASGVAEYKSSFFKAVSDQYFPKLCFDDYTSWVITSELRSNLILSVLKPNLTTILMTYAADTKNQRFKQGVSGRDV
ncbi:hypothetical protein LC593_29505 [Nostoc sp. CHAB 5844]|nr:hypothetical protein [Nostoc sp. CHAB 5844]